MSEPPTRPERPDAIARVVARVLEGTGLTRELIGQTPLPTLLAITLLLDEIEVLRAERTRGPTERPEG
jgi:hypothetical protein